MDVSIIIVNYNTKELTRNCLKSVFEQTKDIDFEVIVSDNGSTDGSIEMIKTEFPKAILIENNENLGFGAANNRGLVIAKGKYIFYLNSDTLLLNNAVKMFFDYWENAEDKELIGAIGGILLDVNFQPIHSGASFPTYSQMLTYQLNMFFFHVIKTIVICLHFQNTYRKRQKKLSKSISVSSGEVCGYITGADLFLRNNDDAYFDEAFFMYYEETDLELKLALKGLKRYIISEPRIQHLTRKIDKELKVANFADICAQESALIYSRKNLGKKSYLLRFLIFIDRLNPFLWEVVRKVPTR